MKPICVKCRLFFRMKKAGYYFIEGMPKDSHMKAWQPYKVWVGDLWECKGCGAQILAGFGYAPVSERHHDDFDEVIERTGAERLQVNDC